MVAVAMARLVILVIFVVDDASSVQCVVQVSLTATEGCKVFSHVHAACLKSVQSS